MSDPLRLFVLAGEPSGDRIGADLVHRLRSKGDVEVSGVGGDELAAAGLRSMFPMRELAVMGWADVLPRLPLLLWRARQVARAIVKSAPDVVVLIDAQEFSRTVARQVRAAGAKVPMLLYVAPTVWAWKPERAKTLNGLFDEVLAVLPFEPRVMDALGGPRTTYVGHPALARIAPRPALPERGPLLLLPGSREGELRRHLPAMAAIAERYAGHPRVAGIVIPTPRATATRVGAAVAGWSTPVEVVATEAGKLAAFESAIAAVAVTGTVTLELALADVPMVTTYVSDRGQDRRFFEYGVRFISLPNAILDRSLVPEVLGRQPEIEWLTRELDNVLGAGAASQLEGFAEIRALMRHGAPGTPLADAAERVLSYVRER